MRTKSSCHDVLYETPHIYKSCWVVYVEAAIQPVKVKRLKGGINHISQGRRGIVGGADA
jgi:hypothetical protein